MNWAGFWFLLWLCIGLLGHLALWVAFFNRTHAIGLPRWFLQLSEKLQVLAIIGIGAGWLLRLWRHGNSSDPLDALRAGRLMEGLYFCGAGLFLCWVVARWLVSRWRSKQPPAWIGFTEQRYDVERELNQRLVRGVVSRALDRKSTRLNSSH